MTLEEKHIIAVLPANPFHCPKCSGGLIERDFPIAVFADNGIHFTDAETHFFCQQCNIEWQPHQIPDHPLYEPEDIIDPTECPHCGAHARRETDIDLHGDYHVHTYICAHCEKLWTERHENH